MFYSPAQKVLRKQGHQQNVILCPVNCSQTPRKQDLHKHVKTLSANMPRTKVDDAERKRQGRAASPSERGRRSERAPWSKARDSNRKRQECAPSRTSSADATGQALSKKARALARIRPFLHSFAASITAPAPAQQLKCQRLAFDDSSREAAAASGLAIVKVFSRTATRSVQPARAEMN